MPDQHFTFPHGEAIPLSYHRPGRGKIYLQGLCALRGTDQQDGGEEQGFSVRAENGQPHPDLYGTASKGQSLLGCLVPSPIHDQRDSEGVAPAARLKGASLTGRHAKGSSMEKRVSHRFCPAMLSARCTSGALC